MDWNGLRRIVTENNAAGRSVVMLDGTPAKVMSVEDGGLAEIWTAALNDDLQNGEDRLSSENIAIEPEKGHVKIRWFTVPVADDDQSLEEQHEQAEAAFVAAGGSHIRVDTSRHPMMHKTDSLDVIVLVRGQIDLLLDEGEALNMKPGDVVIQRGTNHAWTNPGKETALLVAVLMNAGAT